MQADAASSRADDSAHGLELPAGYEVEAGTGAWLTLPWPGDPSLPWDDDARIDALPPSLGWGIIGWAQDYLVHHLTGDPWRFTPAQRRFLILWYAVQPDGKWLYRSGVKRGAKGTGKDPLCAAMMMAGLCGPTRFVGWNGAEPVGQPHRMPLVQIAANSEAQAAEVLRVANAMASNKLRGEFRFDFGKLRTENGSGGRIKVLTSSEASAEGDPATEVYLNESHHMTQASGRHGIAEVGQRNAAKSPDGNARVLELTNSWMPGEDSIAEQSYDAWQKQVSGQTRAGVDILYDSREAAANLRLHVPDELALGIAQAYSDSPWTDQARIAAEAQDPRVPVHDSIRFYFNAIPTNEEAWVEPRKFDSLARDVVVDDGEWIAMFLDCSKSEDATALMACRLLDGHLITLGAWQRPHGMPAKDRWLAPAGEVDAIVRRTFERYSIAWFGVDPSPAKDDDAEALYWQPWIDGWHRDFRDDVLLWATPGDKIGSAVLFDMRMSQPGGLTRNRTFTEAAEATAADIDDYDPNTGAPPPLTHDGNARLRTHTHNARRRVGQFGVSLGKRTRDSSRLVDLAVAMVGARMGRRIVLNSGKWPPKKRAASLW